MRKIWNLRKKNQRVKKSDRENATRGHVQPIQSDPDGEDNPRIRMATCGQLGDSGRKNWGVTSTNWDVGQNTAFGPFNLIPLKGDPDGNRRKLRISAKVNKKINRVLTTRLVQ